MSQFDHELHLRMEELNVIGESRQMAKLEYKQVSGDENYSHRTIGIHSYGTYKTYKQTSCEFSSWVKSEHKDIKQVHQVTPELVKEYLTYRKDRELSPWTVDKDTAALNKIFNFKVVKKDFGGEVRSIFNISRSRTDNAHKNYNPENYKEQIIFALGSGFRRESATKIDSSRVVWGDDGLIEKIFLIEKGGKKRYAEILKAYRPEITKIINKKSSDAPFFESYTRKIDNHSFRRQYCQLLYKQYASEEKHLKSDYRGFDSKLMKKVSKQMGHNRISVIYYHYLK